MTTGWTRNFKNTLQVIPLPLLSLFSSKVLGKLITGEVDIPIGLLKKVTVYKGITVDSGMVQDNPQSILIKIHFKKFGILVIVFLNL